MFWFICGVIMGIYLDQTFTIPSIQKTIEHYRARNNKS
jgi:hypothetical protein